MIDCLWRLIRQSAGRKHYHMGGINLIKQNYHSYITTMCSLEKPERGDDLFARMGFWGLTLGFTQQLN